MWVKFMAKEKAHHHKHNIVNRNDMLGKIEIHNAAAQGLDETHSVEAIFHNKKSEHFGHAHYDEMSDRLIFHHHGVPLHRVTALKFVPQWEKSKVMQ